MTVDDELLVFAADNNIKMIEYCLERGANINHQNSGDKQTPLLYILTFGAKLETIKFLIEHGADPTIIDIFSEDFVCVLKILHTAAILSDINTATKNFEDVFNWMCQYDTQQYLIEKWPLIFISLKQNDILHKDIIIEYSHLNNGSELNLL